MTLTEFLHETLLEVLNDTSNKQTINISQQKRLGKKRFISEAMIIDTYENGGVLELGENDILSPLAKDTLKKYHTQIK